MAAGGDHWTEMVHGEFERAHRRAGHWQRPKCSRRFLWISEAQTARVRVARVVRDTFCGSSHGGTEPMWTGRFVRRCETAAQDKFARLASAARSQPYYLDITHPSANKGAVVDYL